MKMETKDCLGLLERKGILEGGVTKDLKETKGKEEMLELGATRVTQGGTASREDPKEKPETSGPWVCLGVMVSREVLENQGGTVALAEGDHQELRATRAVLASRAPWESRGPEVHRVHLVPPVLQG